ncbi:uncharacterized protein [Arachis hypogaea]|uniref:uncharacterized protein isoform X4 n=1 Tax=Arachis hypogaea TaxID=3818 RepID=UPI003B22437C
MKKDVRTKNPELVDLTTDSVGHDEFVTPYGRRDTKCKLDDDKCYNRFPLRYSGGKKQILEVMLVKLDRILKMQVEKYHTVYSGDSEKAKNSWDTGLYFVYESC